MHLKTVELLSMQVFVDALSIRKLYLQVYHYHFSSFFFFASVIHRYRVTFGVFLL
jgi:hypothetical protein